MWKAFRQFITLTLRMASQQLAASQEAIAQKNLLNLGMKVPRHLHYPLFVIMKVNIDMHFINLSTTFDTQLTSGRVFFSLLKKWHAFPSPKQMSNHSLKKSSASCCNGSFHTILATFACLRNKGSPGLGRWNRKEKYSVACLVCLPLKGQASNRICLLSNKLAHAFHDCLVCSLQQAMDVDPRERGAL